jgi:hypothetical protein
MEHQNDDFVVDITDSIVAMKIFDKSLLKKCQETGPAISAEDCDCIIIEPVRGKPCLGSVILKGRPIKLPDCVSNVKIKDESFKIKSIKINLSSKYTYAIRYKMEGGFESYNRAEENLYASKEEAQAACDNLNKERIFININDIVINADFSKTIPNTEKISERLNEYKELGTFKNEIVINKQNVLTDGYTTYLVCRMLNIPIVKTIIE